MAYYLADRIKRVNNEFLLKNVVVESKCVICCTLTIRLEKVRFDGDSDSFDALSCRVMYLGRTVSELYLEYDEDLSIKILRRVRNFDFIEMEDPDMCHDVIVMISHLTPMTIVFDSLYNIGHGDGRARMAKDIHDLLGEKRNC